MFIVSKSVLAVSKYLGIKNLWSQKESNGKNSWIYRPIRRSIDVEKRKGESVRKKC